MLYDYFKYKVMLFDLINALASFQCYMKKIFADKLAIFVIICINNNLMYIKNPGLPQVKAICAILEQLRKQGLFAKQNKNWFYWDEV